jgi:hypothetical protein
MSMPTKAFCECRCKALSVTEWNRTMHVATHWLLHQCFSFSAALTEKRKAAAAGDGFDLKVCHRPRNDGLHLAAEKFNLLRLLRARLAYQLADSVLELQCTPAGVFVCCLAIVLPHQTSHKSCAYQVIGRSNVEVPACC